MTLAVVMLSYAKLYPMQVQAVKKLLAARTSLINYQLAVSGFLVTAYYLQLLTLCGVQDARSQSIDIVVSSLIFRMNDQARALIVGKISATYVGDINDKAERFSLVEIN